MTAFRPEFAAFFDGYLLNDSFADITERIERAAEWVKMNGGLRAAESDFIRLMIRLQFDRADQEGIALTSPEGRPLNRRKRQCR